MMYAVAGGVVIVIIALVVVIRLAKGSGKDEAKAEILEDEGERNEEAAQRKRDVLVDADERKRLRDKNTR